MGDFGDRALASVRRVTEILPIKKADRLELAMIGGWRCVVGKGEFKAGDLGVYFEIDSFLPTADARFEMLADLAVESPEGKMGARVRTKTFRGALSQGLLLRTALFPEIGEPAEGADVTAALGVIKWDEPLPEDLVGVAKGYLPGRIRRTRQGRIQNEPHWLLDEQEWEASQKLDGESMTIYRMDASLGVCSHSVDLLETEGCSFWGAARASGLLSALEAHGGDWAIQGELIGPGIKGNPERLAQKKFVVFGVFDIDKQRGLAPDERRAFMGRMRGLGASEEQAPVVARMRLDQGFKGLDELLAHADGPSLISGRPREGLVWERVSDAVSFKAISNAYLLGEPEPAKKIKPKM